MELPKRYKAAQNLLYQGMDRGPWYLFGHHTIRNPNILAALKFSNNRRNLIDAMIPFQPPFQQPLFYIIYH